MLNFDPPDTPPTLLNTPRESNERLVPQLDYLMSSDPFGFTPRMYFGQTGTSGLGDAPGPFAFDYERYGPGPSPRYRPPIDDPFTPARRQARRHQLGFPHTRPAPFSPPRSVLRSPAYTPSPMTRAYPTSTPHHRLVTPSSSSNSRLSPSYIRARQRQHQLHQQGSRPRILTPHDIKLSGIPAPAPFPGPLPEGYLREWPIPAVNRESTTAAEKNEAREARAKGKKPKSPKKGGMASKNPWDYVVDGEVFEAEGGENEAEGEDEVSDDEGEEGMDQQWLSRWRAMRAMGTAGGKRQGAGLDGHAVKRMRVEGKAMVKTPKCKGGKGTGKHIPESEPKVKRRSFSDQELVLLRTVWYYDPSPSKDERQRIAAWFGAKTKHVTVWLQNRRAHLSHFLDSPEVQAGQIPNNWLFTQTTRQKNGEIKVGLKCVADWIINVFIPDSDPLEAVRAILRKDLTRDDYLAVYPTPPGPPAPIDPRRGSARCISTTLDNVMSGYKAGAPKNPTDKPSDPHTRLRSRAEIFLMSHGSDYQNQLTAGMSDEPTSPIDPANIVNTDNESDSDIVRYNTTMSPDGSFVTPRQGGIFKLGRVTSQDLLASCSRARDLQAGKIAKSASLPRLPLLNLTYNPGTTVPSIPTHPASSAKRPQPGKATRPKKLSSQSQALKSAASASKGNSQVGRGNDMFGSVPRPAARGFGMERDLNGQVNGNGSVGGSRDVVHRQKNLYWKEPRMARRKGDEENQRGFYIHEEDCAMTGMEMPQGEQAGVRGMVDGGGQEDGYSAMMGKGKGKEKQVDEEVMPDAEWVAAQCLMEMSSSPGSRC